MIIPQGNPRYSDEAFIVTAIIPGQSTGFTEDPELTHSDLRLCAYLRLNLSSREIAPLLRISVRGVENHRYQIRKKLGLKSEENLTEFIISF